MNNNHVKISFLFVLSSIFLFSCAKTIEIPENVLDKPTMIAILTDIHLLEGKLKQISISPDSSAILYNAFEKQIFDRHGVTEAKYIESYSWYFNNLRAFEVVYGTVVDSLLVHQQTKKLFD